MRAPTHWARGGAKHAHLYINSEHIDEIIIDTAQ
jgi:hypothetical protein